MIDTKSLRRALVLTTALAACAAPPAAARVADAPSHGAAITPSATGVTASDRGVPPRIDGIGARPRDGARAVPVRLTQPSRGGFDWTSGAIGATALLSLALLSLAAVSARARGHSRARS
jgi:hypothetical protein